MLIRLACSVRLGGEGYATTADFDNSSVITAPIQPNAMIRVALCWDEGNRLQFGQNHGQLFSQRVDMFGFDD